MLYNYWIVNQRPDGEFSITCDRSDMRERVKTTKYTPTGVPGRAWIGYPRRDDETDTKYKRVLMDYVRKQLNSQIALLNKQISQLEEL